MVRVPSSGPIVIPPERVVREPDDLEGQLLDGGLYGEVYIKMFPEPDHVPELEAQVVYEELRDGDPWAGIEEPRAEGSERQGIGQLPIEIHRGRRGLCKWPSHQAWAVERFGRSRDDQHTD